MESKKVIESKDQLTNEKLRKKFASQFELVNYAIKLAENMIQTGRDSRVKIDSQNRSLQVLNEILCDKDCFDEIIDEEPEIQAPEPKKYENTHSEKNSERKKNRKAFAD